MENQLLNPLEKPPPYSIATAPAVNVPYQPPPGYYPNNTDTGCQENYIPSYGSVHSMAIIVPEIILVGGCPACRVGVMEDDYTCFGLLCAILFFPFGIICCMLLKTKRCSNCGAYFG